MSAARHATDANSEAVRLHLFVQDLVERNLLGENITTEQLSALLRKTAFVQFNTARTQYAVSQFAERRAAEVAAAIPTAGREALEGMLVVEAPEASHG